MSVLSRGIYHNKRSHSLCSSYMAANMRTVWGGHWMCGPQRRQGGHVLLVTGSDVYCNGEKGNKAAIVRDCNFRDVTGLWSKRFRASSSRKSGQVQKRGMKCSRSNFWAKTRLKTLADAGWYGTDNTGPFFNFFVLFNRKSINEAQFCFITS